MFISAMDMTIVNVALPDMSNDLDAGIGELQWVLDAFLVSLAGLLLVGNGLADRFGRRRVFLWGLVGFAVTSALAAASQTVGEAIVARALMGVAASCVLPPALSLLAVLFPVELRHKATGIWSAVGGLGLALGPVVGGVLVDVAGWRWVFLVNIPFVLLAVPLGRRLLPESRRPGVPPLDIRGVVLSTLGLTGIVFALIEGVDAGWTNPAVLAAIGMGKCALGGSLGRICWLRARGQRKWGSALVRGARRRGADRLHSRRRKLGGVVGGCCRGAGATRPGDRL
jgi:MFS family permease